MSGTLRSKLGYFQVRVASSSFLSDDFTWQVNTALSSDPDRLLSKAASFADRVDYSFEIDRLAAGQQVYSEKLKTREASDFETGTYAYTLTVNDTEYDIDIEIENNIGDPATNKTVLLAVERSINRLGLDVEASIETSSQVDYNPHYEDELVQMSQLKIESTDTGTQISFSLEDTSGDLIETLGLNQTTRFAAQNEYRVNGSAETSDDNSVTYASGNAQAQLLGTTEPDENLRISIDKDRQLLNQELTGIIEDYNELIQWIDDNDDIISPSLKKALFGEMSSLAVQNASLMYPEEKKRTDEATQSSDFASVIKGSRTSVIDNRLSDIGLNLGDGGQIDITDEFETFLASDLKLVHETLAGTDGFFTGISDAIETIHGTREDSYIIPLNSVLSYNSEGSGRRGIYQSNSGSIISFFA